MFSPYFMLLLWVNSGFLNWAFYPTKIKKIVQPQYKKISWRGRKEKSRKNGINGNKQQQHITNVRRRSIGSNQENCPAFAAKEIISVCNALKGSALLLMEGGFECGGLMRFEVHFKVKHWSFLVMFEVFFGYVESIITCDFSEGPNILKRSDVM